MRTCSQLASLAAVLLAASPAWSHFVWVAVEKNSAGQPEAHVWFSELAEPDNPDLLDRITKVNVWSRSASGAAAPIAPLKKHDHGGGGGALIGSVSNETNALSAHINYGVLTRRDQTFLLHYHAKYLNAAAKDLKVLARDAKLDFDIVPHATGSGYNLEVLFRGKPAAASEVVILDPAGDEKETKTDAGGRVALPGTKPGLYSIRAKWTVTEAGSQDGKQYPQVNHYCTLAMRIPGSQVGATGQPAAGLTASDLLHKARDTRAVWNNFAGFEADLNLFAEGRQQQGRITVSKDGEVTLHGFGLEDEKALLGTLRSLVSHRLAASESDDRASFADGELHHPLGRLIKLEGDAMASTYRIKDDVIREVNREMGGGRFTISVFDVNRNPEGKYLPGNYTVSYWNKDGSLKSASVIRETWTRIGQLDLPAQYDAVLTGASEHRNVSMKFSNHKLLK